MNIDRQSVVYLIHIGKFVKIGVTTNLARRLKAFATGTAESTTVLATFPGTRADEVRLHQALAETRLPRGEFFHLEYRVLNFIDFVKLGRMDDAWQWLDTTSPFARQKAKDAALVRRVAEKRHTRAERDAHYANLRAERKARLGW